MKRKNNSYIFGFVDEDGDPYDYHISDDLRDQRTWNSIDFKFSLPYSKYILIWRRDGKKFTKSETNYLIEYVTDDMKEYMSEGESDLKEGEDGQTKIVDMLIPSKDCLVLAYDKIILPNGHTDWKGFSDLVSVVIDDMVETANQGIGDNEIIEDILEGKEIKNPILENFRNRTVPYTGYSIPSEKILETIYNFIKKGSYVDAGSFLSGFYEISPPIIKIKTDLINSSFVFYDVVNTTLFMDITKIPEFWQQLPSFFMGFFRHLSLMKNWSYGSPEDSISIEKEEAERFCNDCIGRLLILHLDPRDESS